MEVVHFFKKARLDTSCSFERLVAACKLEDTGKGRKGGIVVNVATDGSVPIVRTTTCYTEPAQRFADVHFELCDALRKTFELPDLAFNNAMVEVYERTYTKMGFHTDQSQDLASASFICLVSFYENDSSNEADFRKLVVENKGTRELQHIVLEQGSAVLFSTETNFRHLHKIVLESQKAKNRWIGVTLRCSKTFVQYDCDGRALLPNGKSLRLAIDETERKQIYHLKSQENATNGEFEYPELDFTLSKSDLMKII